MRLLKRLAAALTLLALLALAGCSSLTLAYQQMPLLAGLWIDSYLDLDSGQRAQLKQQLQAWQTWHRREELPQWQALLRQAQSALEAGVTRDELLALERGARASAERSLQHAAPLAAPLLAGLRPGQWLHLQKEMDDKAAEWHERNSGRGAPHERAKRYANNLERWLGDLDRATLKQARADAESWHFDLPMLAQGRATRQARTTEALRAWSHGDAAAGTALLMQNLQPLPAEQAYREEIIASLLKLLNGLDAKQREQVHHHWDTWSADLRTLQAGS
ncbi:DUF6279 family lipoprotein [Roseateles cellulosilyticus]|uniref:DUF6279 family lipoprotein n=1 Tax=Pelomonas cellulosilytica TaxID=2906762 RepID=A0ABS8XSE3_9BURK|nr:DUF6279 family lipoprotein [Pelomonas sp. P8]MCE4554215.1 DUF6279 family lipoprotein [Pelomonas sp. P8]